MLFHTLESTETRYACKHTGEAKILKSLKGSIKQKVLMISKIC